MANPFVHVELNTHDVGKAKEFYGSLFDWKLEDVPMGAMGTIPRSGWEEGRAEGSCSIRCRGSLPSGCPM